MQKYESYLKEHQFFKGFDLQHIQQITECASDVQFKAGEFVIHEEAEANFFYIIYHGKIAIQLFSPERGPLTIQTVEAGDILGWSWLIPPYRFQFDAVALELTRAIALDGLCLRMKCEQDHDLGYELLKRFSHIFVQRLHATRLQLMDMYKVHT